jgi:hypothetical protein
MIKASQFISCLKHIQIPSEYKPLYRMATLNRAPNHKLLEEMSRIFYTLPL